MAELHADHPLHGKPWAYEVDRDTYVVLTPLAHGNMFVREIDYDLVRNGAGLSEAALAEQVSEIVLQTLHYPNGEAEHEESHWYNLHVSFPPTTSNRPVARALDQMIHWARQVPSDLDTLYQTWHEVTPFADALWHVYDYDMLPEDAIMMGSVVPTADMVLVD